MNKINRIVFRYSYTLKTLDIWMAYMSWVFTDNNSVASLRNMSMASVRNRLDGNVYEALNLIYYIPRIIVAEILEPLLPAFVHRGM